MRYRAPIAALSLLGILLIPDHAIGFDIVRDGKPVARIIIPAKPHEYTKQAADLLVKYTREITGAKLEVIKEDHKKANLLPRIVLGDCLESRRAGIKLDAFAHDQAVCRVIGRTLFLTGVDKKLGADGARVSQFAGCRGTMNAVFKILHDHAGIRWLTPTPDGTYIPKNRNFRVPDKLSDKVDFPFAFIDPRLSRFGEWSWSFGFRRAINIKMTGGHSWDASIHLWGDPGKLYEKHPDLFVFAKGKRLPPQKAEWTQPGKKESPYHGVMLCTSHPQYIPMQVKYFKEMFDAGWDWVEFGVSDGYYRCQCDQCEKMDELDEKPRTYRMDCWDYHPFDHQMPSPERIWEPLREIAAQLYKTHPGKKILAIVYGPTLVPPQKAKEFTPNVAIEFTRNQDDYYAEFSSFNEKTAYVYWWGSFYAHNLSPKDPPEKIAVEFHKLIKNGVLGIYLGGGCGLWGLEGRSYYTLGELHLNPNRDLREIVEEYDRLIYGKAASVMTKFYSICSHRIMLGEQIPYTHDLRQNRIYRSMDAYYVTAYPPEVLAELESLLNQALELANGDKRATTWLKITLTQFGYFKSVADIFHAYKKHLFEKTPASKERVVELIAARDRIVQEIADLEKRDPDIEKWFPGYKAFSGSAQSGGRLRGELKKYPPFKNKWD